MLRRFLLSMLSLAALVLLGLGGLWYGGWWPAQTANQPSPQPSSQSTPESAPYPDTPVQPSAPTPIPAPDLPEVTVEIPAMPQPAPQAPTEQVLPGPPSRADATTQANLSELNAVRALAKLPPVSRAQGQEAACRAHARYLALADRGEHREDPQSPYASAAGQSCVHGHYFVSSQADSGAQRAVRYWATGVFHLPQLLNPRLRSAALGEAHDPQGEVRSAVVLDVRSGLTDDAQVDYPVRFPAPQQITPYTTAASFEWPDPLPGCPGFTHPVGAPIALLLGQGAKVTSAALKVNGQAVQACLLTAQTFQGAQQADTRVGQGVLASQGAAVLLPRQPFPPGANVQVNFKAPHQSYRWSFRVQGHP